MPKKQVDNWKLEKMLMRLTDLLTNGYGQLNAAEVFKFGALCSDDADLLDGYFAANIGYVVGDSISYRAHCKSVTDYIQAALAKKGAK